jgi:hypothetical protein
MRESAVERSKSTQTIVCLRHGDRERESARARAYQIIRENED